MRLQATLAFLIVAMGQAGVSAQARAPSIVGAWRFESEVDTRPDGSVVTIGPADGWNGYAVYTSDGFVSVNIMPKGRKWTLKSATLKELRRTFEDASAYAGRYEVDAAAGTVTLLVQTSLDPADENKHHVRRFRIDGDTLTLSGTFRSVDGPINFTIRWARER
jgi:hypothetical protein